MKYMPVKITRQENGKYIVSTPNGVKGRDMTLANAKKQQRLLNVIEYSDWRPTKKRKGGLLKHK